MTDSESIPEPRAMPRAVMYVLPGAAVDRGVDRALDDALACGVDGIQVALSYHTGTFVFPQGRRQRVHHGSLGALQFEPARVPDVEWPFAPPVDPAVAGDGGADLVVEGALRRELHVTAWLVACFHHALARARPELAVRNVYGEPSGAHLCPVDPTVRRYALALVRSALMLGPVHAVHVESLGFLPYGHGWLNPKAAVEPGAEARRALSWCFCPSCRAAATGAGVDIVALRLALRRWLDDVFEALPDGPGAAIALAEALGEHRREDLARYLAMRTERVVALQRQVRATARRAQARFTTGLVETPERTADENASDAIRPSVDAVRVRVPRSASPRTLTRDLEAASAGVAPGTPIYAFLEPGVFGTEAEFANAVHQALRAGFQRFSFYELGLLSARQLEWIRNLQRPWL